MNVITQKLLDESMSYHQYRVLVKELLAQNETTTEGFNDEWILNYTKLNDKRMDRLDKKLELVFEIHDQLADLSEDWIWLVITEGWCGDAAQNVPVLAKIAALNAKIDLKLILRDQHLDVMDAYLTNGGRSIPKLIVLRKADMKELGTWGPRPEEVQQMVIKAKEDNIDRNKFIEQVHHWYTKDKTLSMQKEILELIKEWIENGK